MIFAFIMFHLFGCIVFLALDAHILGKITLRTLMGDLLIGFLWPLGLIGAAIVLMPDGGATVIWERKKNE